MTSNTPIQSLGADIRSLRKTRGLTLNALADQVGKSVGWLSQVERDLSHPTPDDLEQFCRALQVPPELLQQHHAAVSSETGVIVRKTNRRAIGHRRDGLTEELLSPDLTDDFEVVHSVFHPNSHLPEPCSRPTQELGYVIEGRLDIVIDGTPYTVDQGDSFRIRGQAYQWSNPYDAPCFVVWIIAPPVY